MKAPPVTGGNRRIGPIGTAARACVGAGLAVGVAALKGVTWWDLAGAVLVLPLLALGTVALANAVLDGTSLAVKAREPWSRTQVAAAGVTVVGVLGVGTALTFVSPMDGVAIYMFVGASMVLAAIVGYDGCEILALPNLVFGRRDAIWCPLYSRLDAAEQQLNGDFRAP